MNDVQAKMEHSVGGNKFYSESILILNQHGVIRWASPSIHSQLGYKRSDIIGKVIFGIVCNSSFRAIEKMLDYVRRYPANRNEGLRQFTFCCM